MATTSAPTIPAAWRALVDDAAVFPPGDADLADDLDSDVGRCGAWWADLVVSFGVPDTARGSVRTDVPVADELTSGAGAVEGVAAIGAR